MDPQHTHTATRLETAKANYTDIPCHSKDGLTEAQRLFVERLKQRVDQIKSTNAKQEAHLGEKETSEVMAAQTGRATEGLSVETPSRHGSWPYSNTPPRCFYSPAPKRETVVNVTQDATAPSYAGKTKETDTEGRCAHPSSPVTTQGVRSAWPPMPRGIPLLEDYFETFPPTIDLRDDSDSEFEDELDSEEELIMGRSDQTTFSEEDLSDDEDCSCCGPSVAKA